MTAPDGYEARLRESFARQAAMRTIGAEIAHVAPGEVDLRMAYRGDLTQQHGFVPRRRHQQRRAGDHGQAPAHAAAPRGVKAQR